MITESFSTFRLYIYFIFNWQSNYINTDIKRILTQTHTRVYNTYHMHTIGRSRVCPAANNTESSRNQGRKLSAK